MRDWELYGVRVRRLFAWAIGCLIAWSLAASPALAETRVALVIGNDTYATLPNLNNAGTDARGIAAKLTSLGFETILETNVGRRKIGRAIARFRGRLAKADVGLVFFAGHGIQLDGENYLVPSDARVEVEEDLPYEAVRASDFLVAMADAGTPLNIVIIDACRDNPLPKRTRSLSRGLAVVAVPQSIKGTAILYSASPGQVAQDGPPGGHGVFTGALLDVLDRPGLKLEDVFKQTAAKVAAITDNAQDPWINSSVKGDFYFRGKTSTQPEPVTGPADKELIFWRSVQNSGDPLLYKAYLEQYPDGTFAPLARARIEGLANKKAGGKSSKNQAMIQVEERDERMWVNANSLSVRGGPGTKFDRVDRLPRGSEVEVTGKAVGSKWYRIKTDDGETGFVFGKYLTEEAPRKKYHVEDATPEPTSAATPTLSSSSALNSLPPPSGGIELVNASGLRLSPSASQLIKDIVRRSFSGSEWARVDRVTVRLTNVEARIESNPEYAGAKIAQGVFSAFLGGSIQLGNVSKTITVYRARATVIANLKDGNSWTDAATNEVKGDGQGNRARKVTETVMNAVSQATNRVVIRMSGGAPPVESSGLNLGGSTQPSNNTETTWDNPDDDDANR